MNLLLFIFFICFISFTNFVVNCQQQQQQQIYSISQIPNELRLLVIDCNSNQIVQNTTISYQYEINGILSINETTVLVLSGYETLISIDIKSGDFKIIKQLKNNYVSEFSESQLIYDDNIVRMPMLLLEKEANVTVLDLNFNQDDNSIAKYNSFNTPTFSSNYGTPVGGYDYINKLMYIVYPSVDLHTDVYQNLIQYDPLNIKSSKKYFNQIKNIEYGYINIVYTDNKSNLYIGYSNLNAGNFEICLFDSSTNSCSNVIQTPLLTNFSKQTLQAWNLSNNKQSIVLVTAPTPNTISFDLYDVTHYNHTQYNITNYWTFSEPQSMTFFTIV